MNPTPTPREIAEMTKWQAEQKAAASTKPDEQAAFEDWLYRVCPAGDVTEVQRQWEESAALVDHLEDLAEWETANPPSPRAGDSIEGEQDE